MILTLIVYTFVKKEYMKNVILLVLVICAFSCKKESCYSCVSYQMSNKIEAQKKCNGLNYDLSNYEESLIGQDYGSVCGESEKESNEVELNREKINLCEGVDYNVITFIKCD